MLSVSSSDAQIFNCSKLRRKIENDTLGLLSPEHLDTMGCETLQQKTTHKGREISKLQDLQRQECGGECMWNPSEHIHGTTGHNGEKAKGCQRHCFDM